MKNQYGLEACMSSIEFQIEYFKENPHKLLGEFVIRAEKDPFFNRTMITALKKYINDNNL